MMNIRGKLECVPGMTGKPVKDMVTKKTQLAAACDANDFSESSSDSDAESCCSFAALPQEFRPNSDVHKQHAHEGKKDVKISIEQGKQQMLQTPVVNKSTSTSLNTSRDYTQSRAMKDESTLSFQKLAMSLKSNRVCGTRVKTNSQTEKNTILCEGKEQSRITGSNGVKGNALLQKTVQATSKNRLKLSTNSDLFLKETNEKKSLHYEHIKIHEQSTIRMNFDMLSFKDANSIAQSKLKYDAKLVPVTRTIDKKESLPNNEIMYQNLRKVENNAYLPTEQFLPQQGVVKWDDSLNLIHDEKLIEWSVVQKTKTFTITERKITDVSQQLSNVYVSEKSYYDCPRSSNFHHSNVNDKNCTKPKNFQKNNITKTKFRVNKRNDSKHIPTKRHQLPHINDSQKISYTINKRDFSPKIETWNTEKSSSTETYTVSAKATDSSSCRCSSNESLDSSPNDLQNDELWNNKIVTLPKSLNEDDFTQLNKTSNKISLPAKVLNFTQNDNSVKDLQVINESILSFGKEISNLIIGCYTALSWLISFYREWTQARRKLLDLLEQLEKNLKESSEKFSTYSEILLIAKSGAELASNIPVPHVSIAARIVTMITGLLQSFVKTKKVDQDNNIDDLDDIARVIFKCTRATSDLHMYGLQCSLQFEETTTLIKNFHSNTDIKNYFNPENPDITNFITGFLEYKPNHQIFYKKLHRCFQELLQTGATILGRKFCEPFTLFSSSALNVIEYLGWRFRCEDFDSSSVTHELDEIYNLIQNSSTTDVKVLHRRIRSCIGIIEEELEFSEKCFKDVCLFDNTCDKTKTF